MCRPPLLLARSAGLAVVIATGVFQYSVVAQEAGTRVTSPGFISLDVPDLPPPTVEVDLGQGLIQHAIQMGDAAAAGFLQGLTESAEPSTAENMKFIAQQLTSAREFGEAAGGIIEEVHIRAWERLESDSRPAEVAVNHFNDRLRAQGWEPTVRAREGNKQACIYVLRDGESLNGVFLVAGEGNKLVLVNVIGDLSAENVHRLTETATRIGVKFGLDKELNRAVEKMKEKQARHAR